ncbi:MAG: calcium-binding protein [Paracoccaceae bacterium]|nr:calcium-binding protein [Paracoccaceae bacterium]
MSLVGLEFSDEEYDRSRDDTPPPPDDVGGDVIYGGVNSTEIGGTDGDDWIAAGRSCDSVDGGAGDDTLLGERGRDLLEGGEGNDLLNGGAWHDALSGGAGDDVLLGENGKDTLAGGEGNDTLDGGAWDDVLVGGAGADDLSGGAGDDILIGYCPDTPSQSGDIDVRLFHEALERTFENQDTYLAMTEAEQEAYHAELIDEMYATYPGFTAGADAANTLDGGDGNDTIYMAHDGDQAIGGGGDDSFVVYTWADNIDSADDSAPTIQDFGLGDDVMVIEYDAAEPAPVMTIDTLENGDQVIRADGAAVVTLIQPDEPVTMDDLLVVAVEA